MNSEQKEMVPEATKIKDDHGLKRIVVVVRGKQDAKKIKKRGGGGELRDTYAPRKMS
jgi:hypothetical protein